VLSNRRVALRTRQFTRVHAAQIKEASCLTSVVGAAVVGAAVGVCSSIKCTVHTAIQHLVSYASYRSVRLPVRSTACRVAAAARV
jgi:hypothetical protein